MESLHQGKSMLSHWLGPNGDRHGSFYDVAEASMTLSLHIISRAGFGVRLAWEHEGGDQSVPEGHTMTFRTALATLLDQIIQLIILPKWWLGKKALYMSRKLSMH